MQDFISTLDLKAHDIRALVDRACDLSSQSSFFPVLAGKIVALAFFQPSTRTRLACEVAVRRLGGDCINLGDQSSVLKGEDFEDTIATLAQMTDCIVIRHPEEGAAEKAASVLDIPVVNAGDGRNELPMGGIALFYQMCCYAKQRGKEVNQLSVIFYGPLKYSRACHSFIHILAKFHVKMFCSCPEDLGLPMKYMKWVEDEGASLEDVSFESALPNMDIMVLPEVAAHSNSYKPKEYRDFVGFYRPVTKALLAQMKPDALLMAIPPRVWEIPKAIDADPRQVYTRMPTAGLYTKMAILASLLGQ